MTHFRKTHFYGTTLDAALDDISKKILTVPHFTVHHLSKITNFRKRNLKVLHLTNCHQIRFDGAALDDGALDELSKYPT
jgi:hypothetical protein